MNLSLDDSPEKGIDTDIKEKALFNIQE